MNKQSTHTIKLNKRGGKQLRKALYFIHLANTCDGLFTYRRYTARATEILRALANNYDSMVIPDVKNNQIVIL